MPYSPLFYRALSLSFLCLLGGCSGNLRFDDELYRPLNTPLAQPAQEHREWN